jgi:hypothetical protein
MPPNIFYFRVRYSGSDLFFLEKGATSYRQERDGPRGHACHRRGRHDGQRCDGGIMTSLSRAAEPLAIATNTLQPYTF